MKSGIIPINKPAGISSAQVVARVKKKLNAGKVGHSGTLDPFATGLLLCAVNKGTKISRFFLGGTKRYTARIRLGVTTDTYDLKGNITAKASRQVMDSLEIETFKDVFDSFLGVQDQVPPVFSALKHKGQPLYRLARQGKAVEKPPRTIEIFDIRVMEINLPDVDIDVSCSAGTYIRSLAFDIGEKLGCGAHLSKLCRTQSSHFTLDTAIELDELENSSCHDGERFLLPLSECLPFLPKIVADTAMEKKIRFGQRLSNVEVGMIASSGGQAVRVLDAADNLLAIIEWDEIREAYNYSCVFCA